VTDLLEITGRFIGAGITAGFVILAASVLVTTTIDAFRSGKR
jgi:hypothetical protein